MATPKSEFRNDSGGILGVVTLDQGKPVGLPVDPGETIWLTEDERIATANAPRREEDNPFANGALTLVTPATEIANRRPIGGTDLPEVPDADEQRRKAVEAQRAKKAQETQVADQEKAREAEAAKEAQQPGRTATPPSQRQTAEETAAPPQPQGTPAQGSRASGEEVGTPGAAAS